MDFVDFTVTEDDSQRRLDRILKRILEGSGTTNINQLLRKGLIKLNGKKADASDHPQINDIISIAKFIIQDDKNTSGNKEKSPENTKNTLRSLHFQEKSDKGLENIPEIQDLFKNRHIRIINKPYGISSQPSASENIDLSTIIQAQYMQEFPDTSLSFKTGPLHRLDRSTTGIMAFSQSSSGARWFSENISSHAIRKTYLAIVQGNMKNNCTWEDYIYEVQDKNNRGFHTVNVISSAENKLSDSCEKSTLKAAVTHAYPLAKGHLNAMDVTLVQFDIETGRKHQIRAQSSFHGFPLLNDTAYRARKIPGLERHFLHAARLTIPENPIGLPPEINAPLPPEFKKMLDSTLIKWNGELII